MRISAQNIIIQILIAKYIGYVHWVMNGKLLFKAEIRVQVAKNAIICVEVRRIPNKKSPRALLFVGLSTKIDAELILY